MLNKKKYLSEMNDLIKKSNVKKDDLLILLDYATGESKEINSLLIENIIKDIFNNESYCTDIMVPWSFFDTEIGKALIRAKLNYEEKNIFFVKDIEKITGYTRQYISQETKAGNLIGEKRGGKVVYKEKDLNEWLVKKGLQPVSVAQIYNEKEEKFYAAKYEREENYDIKNK